MKKIIVLVVDDDRSIRDFYKEILEFLGAKVLIASSLCDALGIIGFGDKPNLIISDFDMKVRGGDGLDLLAKIKHHNDDAVSQIPFVLVSGVMANELSQQAKKLGVTETAQKPISIEDLKRFLSLVS